MFLLYIHILLSPINPIHICTHDELKHEKLFIMMLLQRWNGKTLEYQLEGRHIHQIDYICFLLHHYVSKFVFLYLVVTIIVVVDFLSYFCCYYSFSYLRMRTILFIHSLSPKHKCLR